MGEDGAGEEERGEEGKGEEDEVEVWSVVLEDEEWMRPWPLPPEPGEGMMYADDRWPGCDNDDDFDAPEAVDDDRLRTNDLITFWSCSRSFCFSSSVGSVNLSCVCARRR
jgi:hypothetical protein